MLRAQESTIAKIKMNSALPSIAPLGSWPTLKRYMARETEWQHMGLEVHKKTLVDYAATGRIVYVSPETGMEVLVDRPSRSVYLSAPLAMLAKSNVIDGSRLAVSGTSAQKVLASAVVYRELGLVQNFLVESEFPTLHGRKLSMFSAREIGWVGLAAAVGAIEVAARLAPLLIAATQEGYLISSNSLGMQHWILRLWCKVNGLDYPNTGYPRYDVAEGVLEMWDTQDTELLGAWLVQLCNLHTRLAAQRDNMDFANVFSHFPVEVLLLFRLREQAGLANPEVDHPIMKFPWSRLWPIAPAEPDELLAGVYQRLEMDEGITVQGLYAQLLPA
jgi:hypothetical protein